MKNKISFLAFFAIALNVNYVCASECVGEDCELTPIEITEEIETTDILEPIQYEIDWVAPSAEVCETQEICEHDYNCPFDTPAACAVWYKKPAYKTTVAPRAPHINSIRVDDMIFAIYSYDRIDANNPEMTPLVQRYKMLMNASDACCTSGILYKMRQNGASDKAIYEFLKDDANYFAITKRCMVMSDEDITSNYSNGVNGKMVAEVRDLCLCKNHQWFDSLLHPFDDIYERVPDFANEDFAYSYTDGMGREITVSVNEDVQKAMNTLSNCPK
ncbi:MAG: hypothetical protein IKF41_03470 [Alphaproteobacteria bacterium]|nr:hypothetical protein [Alphaproteobacteria bacterium]